MDRMKVRKKTEGKLRENWISKVKVRLCEVRQKARWGVGRQKVRERKSEEKKEKNSRERKKLVEPKGKILIVEK